MERKISSAFTEFYKIYGILMSMLLLPLAGLPFFNPFDMRFSPFLLAMIVFNFLSTFYFWRMKEVELTDAGLIITERFFFNRKTVFVSFEQIETVKNKPFLWINNKRDIIVKFNEANEFGKEICFMAKGYRNAAQIETIEELKRTVERHRNENRLAAASRQLNI